MLEGNHRSHNIKVLLTNMTPIDSNTKAKRTAKAAALLAASTAAVVALTIGLHRTSRHSNPSENPATSSFRKRELFEDKADITSLVQEPYVVNSIDSFDESDGDDDDQVLPATQMVDGDQYPVTNIALIGERHSGTNWITDHLQDCFGEDILVRVSYSRYKHWFQTDYNAIPTKSTVVVAMFRDPYDWVTAMWERPHHAHNHMDLSWREFVTRPWEGPRGLNDKLSIVSAGGIEEVIVEKKSTCVANYTWNEVIPCSYDDSVPIEGVAKYMYELMHDGSGRAYPSIVDLRKEKIKNFFSMKDFRGVKSFYPMQYEDLNKFGTSSLLKTLEKETGKAAKCDPFAARGTVSHKTADPEFMNWMNQYVDWQVEGMIGYERREPQE
ncbi:hypothetical protein ACHAXS_005721 [Conticribra weissflogii]